MNFSFYIIDDDRSIVKILSNIITTNNLGEVIGTSTKAKDAIYEINAINPDIIIVDCLMPEIDGITLVSNLKAFQNNLYFIMISQVTDKEMIAKAYKNGIDFFINKPINVVEVVSVINKVKEIVNMHKIINSLRNVMVEIDDKNINKKCEPDNRKKIKSVLSKLGVLGESGSNDVLEISLLLLEENNNISMNKIYKKLIDKYQKESKIDVNIATLEQRIRRCINKALNNISNLGLEDYGNDLFIEYSNVFFDFAEVRKQMSFIRGKTTCGGKINVKKFIEGIILISQ